MVNKKDDNSVMENNNLELEQLKKNQRIQDIVTNRVSNLRRKLSRGASNIYRIIRTRCKWGNKKLWGDFEHGRDRPRFRGKHKK